MLTPHDHVLDFVDDYVHDNLTHLDAAHVERHCEACPICKVALEEARKRFAALAALPPCEASEPLVQATLARVAEHETNRRRRHKRLAWGVLSATAAAVLVLGALNLYYLNLSATPYDLTVLAQSTLLAGAEGSLRVRLVNHGTGLPLEGVPVEIELKNKKSAEVVQLASFTTDANGTGQPRFRLPDWEDHDCELRVVARPAGDTETIAQPVQLKRSWKLMLSSDKPVYQPGQTIHLRALALRRPDLRPVAGEPATFSITDPKGNVIFKRQDPTSRFGITSAECPLAGEITEGAYTIDCKVGDTGSKLAVEVKKYVLPKFKVAVDLDQPYYRPGQKVQGSLQADYFFGKPVAGAAVEIEVKFNQLAARLQEKPPEDLRIPTKPTDSAGKASFEFKVPDMLAGREQDSGNARIAVVATVTDQAGQKQKSSLSRVVGAEALRIDVIPESGQLVLNLPNTIYLFVSTPDGRPVPRARVAVMGIEKEVTTNDLGVASFEVTPRNAPIGLTVKATDEQGRTSRRQLQLTAGQGYGDFLVRTDKAVYNGGETMRLVALGGGLQPVFVDLIKDGQTMLTETVEMTKGRGEAQIDLPAEMFGTVEVCAYRLGQGGLPIRKTRALYIRQAQQLALKAALDRAEYRPGKRAKLVFNLSDRQGAPAPGALSLAAVDEAVFSVLGDPPGMEKDFYMLDRALLRPVYALYDWSPEPSKGLPRDDQTELEQALFAQTTRAELVADGSKPTTGNQVGNVVPGMIVQRGTGQASASAWVSSTFPGKEIRVQQTQKAGLEWMAMAWGGLICAVAVGWYVCLFAYSMDAAVAVGLFAAMGLLGTMLGCGGKPAAQSRLPRAAATTKSAGLKPPSGPLPGMVRQYESVIETKVEDHSADPGIELEPAEAPRVREWFPETLLWRPELITDDHGRATLDVDLADSITTWRLTASAVTADGRLGAEQTTIRVFQPFFVDLNLPVTLMRGDEVSIPVVVYNYLDKGQTVELGLQNADWFEGLDGGDRRLELAANEVRSTSYRVRVRKVGTHQLQVSARGAGVADAIKKDIEVVPDGRGVEQVQNGTLQQPAEVSLTVPATAIEGSPKAFVKIYPSSFSQLVEGLDGIFQMPHGCFEQTSSTTYPNVLALDYLRRTRKAVPQVEAKARQYIHLGYQRLVGFEVAGGGFDWFGRPPANRTLTAYGLMEFQDMARVHDVDPNLIERTRRWLLSQRKADGSWPAERHMLNDGVAGNVQQGSDLDLGTTAYIAWAVFDGQEARSMVRPTGDYLLAHRPEAIADPHTLALVCNALLAIAPTRAAEVQPYLDRLEALKRTSDDDKRAWWEQAPGARTMFYGAGRSGNVETTALATLALVKAGQYPGTSRAALTWLVQQKDAAGTWYSTQATVLALKALLAGTGQPLGGDGERRIEIALGDQVRRTLTIPADQAEVMQQIDLSKYLTPGTHRLTVTEQTGTAAGYQVVFRYHVPGDDPRRPAEPLAIDLSYDRDGLRVGETVHATATVVNQMKQEAPMVVLDLPIPAGFAVVPDDFDRLTQAGTIARYQVTPRSAIVYLRGLEAGKRLQLGYRLRATMPVQVTVPAARAYEYYDPDRHGAGKVARITVKE